MLKLPDNYKATAVERAAEAAFRLNPPASGKLKWIDPVNAVELVLRLGRGMDGEWFLDSATDKFRRDDIEHSMKRLARAVSAHPTFYRFSKLDAVVLCRVYAVFTGLVHMAGARLVENDAITRLAGHRDTNLVPNLPLGASNEPVERSNDSTRAKRAWDADDERLRK